MRAKIYKRAAVFALLLAISVVLFPLLAFGLATARIQFLGRFVGNFLFFWPQYMLVPYGFENTEIGQSQSFLMDTATYFAIPFWVLCALGYGYCLRNAKMRYVALGTYPIVSVVMLTFYWVLNQFGYSAYLEGL